MNEAHLAVLEFLALVPCATTAQVARAVGGLRLAKAGLASLTGNRLLETRLVQAARPERRRNPLYRSDENARPTAPELARQVRNRFAKTEPLHVHALHTLRRPAHVNHDLGTTEAFLAYRERYGDAAVWTPEQPLRGARVPDARVTIGGVTRVVEHLGCYRATKIAALLSDYLSAGEVVDFW